MRYNAEKAQGKRVDLTSGQNAQKLHTAEQIAREFGVDEKTIRRDGKLAEATKVLLDVGLDRDLVYNQAAEQDVVSLAEVLKPEPARAPLGLCRWSAPALVDGTASLSTNLTTAAMDLIL